MTYPWSLFSNFDLVLLKKFTQTYNHLGQKQWRTLYGQATASRGTR